MITPATAGKKASQPYCSASPSSSRLRFLPPAPCSGLQSGRVDLLCLLLSSDTSAAPLDTGCRHLLCRRAVRPPQVRCSHLHAFACCIYFCVLRTGIELRGFWPPHPTRLPRMQFLFVGPAFCFRLPSDPASRRAPLPSANRSPCRAGGGIAATRLLTSQ